MSKRFIDTGIFDDDWFMDLSKDAKLLWIYMITKCDHAGIIKINEKLCRVQTDIKDLNDVIQQLGNRLVTVNKELPKSLIFFIPKFIEFQYPGFPKSNVMQQISAVEILTKNGLFKDGKITLNQELGNSYDNDNGNDIVIVNGTVVNTWKTNFEIYKSELQESYKLLISNSEFIKEQERLNPNVDVKLSIEKSLINFWNTEAGWKNKKQARINDINWKSTFVKAITSPMNKVYKPLNSLKGNGNMSLPSTTVQ